jgi:predicted TIM-barrel fold metal-dependent hydrolase
MTELLDRTAATDAATRTKFGVFDADTHPRTFLTDPLLVEYLPPRWLDYVKEFGAIHRPRGERPRHREFASRYDAQTPDGSPPGSDPAFAATQLLDRYDMTGALVNDIAGFLVNGAGGQPPEMAVAYSRAMNLHRQNFWLASDPRWYGSISIPYELPAAAVEEIRYCKEETGEYADRWKQVMLAPDNLRPIGHPSYWPIFEACEHYDLPVAFHVLAGHRITPNGQPNFYFEEHCDFALFNFPLVSSLIFEGVFNRFPKLKIVLVELAWSWAVPFAWRLDHAYRMNRREVPHLDRLPSEYLAEHVYYTTQPMEEPERDEWFDGVLDQFEESGMSKNLLFSSDYPHWDFDEPAALPKRLSDDQHRRILGENSSELYHVELLPDSGYSR